MYFIQTIHVCFYLIPTIRSAMQTASSCTVLWYSYFCEAVIPFLIWQALVLPIPTPSVLYKAKINMVPLAEQELFIQAFINWKVYMLRFASFHNTCFTL